MSDLDERRTAALAACHTVGWRRHDDPAETFAALGRAAAELGVDTWDGYGVGGPVERLEREVAELLGKPAVAFFPSGTMAQQAVLRVWCEQQGSTRVAIPDLAHPLRHEEDGPRLLHGFRFEPLTTGRRAPTADDLRALDEGLGAVSIELPLREAGALLPTWEELVALAGAAHHLGVPLHADGARLWESQPFYDRPLAEIAELFDSVYVSFYKGLGGLGGACVAGPADVVEPTRHWRRRMGGALYRMTPYAVSALVGLRDVLPRMGELAAYARDLAAALVDAGMRVFPDPPHTNTFQLFGEADPEVAGLRLVELMERERIAPCMGWSAAVVPGWVSTEVVVHTAALEHDPAALAQWFGDMLS